MNWLQRLRERFWFVPAALCLAAAVAAEVLVRLDRAAATDGPPAWTDVVLYQVGESGSRTVLAAIATSSLAVAGTTFSITMAVLALTSSSYGPRLVRNFMADRRNQAVLGAFTATFLYSLLVLRSVGAEGAGGPDPFVPQLAVNIAVALAVLEVGVLIYFIHHISDSVQIATLSRGVREDLRRAVDVLYPEHLGQGSETGSSAEASVADDDEASELRRRIGDDGRTAVADRSGYVTGVKEEALLGAATEHDWVVELLVRPGEYVLEGSLLLRVHPADVDDEALSALRGDVVIGDLRTPYQDVEFVIQQLTEMAVRALSPGTNDPYTAVNALDDLTVGLTLLAGRPEPSPVRRDPSGAPRVLAPRADPVELVSRVLDAMRWYAAGAPSVMHATLGLAEHVGRQARSAALRSCLLREVDLLRGAFESAGHHAHDIAAFEAHARRVERAIMVG